MITMVIIKANSDNLFIGFLREFNDRFSKKIPKLDEKLQK